MVQITGVAPYFLTADVFATAEYYRDVLGFTFDRIDGKPPSFVIVQRDGTRLMFRQPHEGAPPPSNASLGEFVDAFLYADDVEALAKELRGRQAEIVEGPIFRPIWNGKELIVRDCDGRTLCFGQLMD